MPVVTGDGSCCCGGCTATQCLASCGPGFDPQCAHDCDNTTQFSAVTLVFTDANLATAFNGSYPLTTYLFAPGGNISQLYDFAITYTPASPCTFVSSSADIFFRCCTCGAPGQCRADDISLQISITKAGTTCLIHAGQNSEGGGVGVGGTITDTCSPRTVTAVLSVYAFSTAADCSCPAVTASNAGAGTLTGTVTMVFS